MTSDRGTSGTTTLEFEMDATRFRSIDLANAAFAPSLVRFQRDKNDSGNLNTVKPNHRPNARVDR
ncbi:hypothetical protein EA462_08090 [Natrarchaeobius halalkaliphilus]|uniref:Uncharacterized protein n=1 Tax=Natrarchaeobius halalkaliphilus TaxID=1679091 RepID=A0A3N6LLZ3_9EURY|nr:hypothetical protein EA462_08090 [Natrarchaeobius halalkaliphilus]